MTRDEAIINLKLSQNRIGGIKKEEWNALQMAIEALSAEHKHCWDCKHYEPKYNVCHAPEVVKQVTSKLKKPCDSLLTEESNGSKEQKSKLEHDREWIIGCIKHDGFIKTDRFDKANQIILDALSAEAAQGEWIVREYCTNELDYRRWTEIECPFCGEKPTYEDLDNMNYCPNCGARMKGGDDE